MLNDYVHFFIMVIVFLLYPVANLARKYRGGSCPHSYSSSSSFLLPPLFLFIVSSQKSREGLGGYLWVLGRQGGLIPHRPPCGSAPDYTISQRIGIFFLPRAQPHNNSVPPKENSVVPHLGVFLITMAIVWKYLLS